MANSGTYAFNPPIGSLALNAFGRCGIRRTEITPQHMEDLYLEANLLQADWAADGILWWTVDKTTVNLTQGVATYTVDLDVVSVLDVYITPNGGTGGSNRLILPFARSDYASLANPTQQGFPTTFWYNRVIPATINLWPVPDGSAVYTMTYYFYRQMQDANIASGGNAQIPYWWLNAYVADLAHRMARIYAPALEQQRKADFDEAYAKANKQVEPGDLVIQPGMSSYFR